MSTFTFELVSPERQVFSGLVEQVVVPGAEGEFGVLAGHAPFVSSLKPGILTVHAGGGSPKRLYVAGGFAEISGGVLTILAARAVPVEDVSGEEIDAAIAETEAMGAASKDDETKRKATERVDQLRAVKAALGTAKTTH